MRADISFGCVAKHIACPMIAFGPELHHEFVALEIDAQQQRIGAAESQVDIIPRDRRIAAKLCRRTFDDERMRMALDDVASRLQRRIVKSIRELTQPAAHGSDHAAFLQHAAVDESARPRRTTELTPETEKRACRHRYTIEMPRGDAEVLHLAELHRPFAHTFVRPKHCARLRDDDRKSGNLPHREPPRPAKGFRRESLQPEKTRLEGEEE